MEGMSNAALRTFFVFLMCSVICSADESEFTGVASREKRDVDKLGELNVVTIHHPPYVIVNRTTTPKQYTGFLVDLIAILSKKLNLKVGYQEVKDGKYGSKADGKWDGMIGELVKNEHAPDGTSPKPTDNTTTLYDLAAAPILITGERRKDVDFLYPFHKLGLVVVTQKHYLKQNYSFTWPTFGIFHPLTASVWGMIILTMFAVGLVLSLMNHFNPYEWGGRFNLGQATKHHKESFSFSGSMWFAFSTLQWQGFERAPRSMASKLLTCFWFAFVTVSIVTYTGGLVNNLWWASMAQQVNPLQHPVTSLKALMAGIHGNDYSIGCTKGGNTYRYLTEVLAPQKVEFQLLKVYWASEHGQAQLVDSVADGLKKARSEKYAFFMESLEAKYYMNKQPCDLATIGEEFAYKSYGLAVPENWPHKRHFDEAILDITESGQLDGLEQKWWEGQGECWNNTIIEKLVEEHTKMRILDGKPKAIDLNMFWGPLVAMVIGVFLSLAMGLGEIFYYKYKGRYHESNRPQGQSLQLDDDGRI